MDRVKIDRRQAKKDSRPSNTRRYPGRGKQTGTKAQAERKKIGRPTKRNADTERAILSTLKLGLGYRTAAAHGGVSDVTLRTWRLADPDFEAKCEAARCAPVMLAAATLQIAMRSAGPSAVTAAMFTLKTTSPEHREKIKLEISEDEAPEPDESFL